jgi:MFS transporter, UMF1 family
MPSPDYRLGNLLWSLALAISYAGGGRRPGRRGHHGFLRGAQALPVRSYLLTVVSTALLYFVAPGYIWLGITLIIISNFAYAIGESFIASFLPDLGPPEALGRISGFGWALGYVGGLVSTAFALLFLGEVSEENFERALGGPRCRGVLLPGDRRAHLLWSCASVAGRAGLPAGGLCEHGIPAWCVPP